jgi:Salmonella virulence plasmid 65kDa B protein
MHTVERQFARIERWTSLSDPSQIHWRVTDKDNTTFIYGRDQESRIYASSSSQGVRIFSWLLAESYDDKGNAAIYGHKRENQVGIDASHPAESRPRYRNRYLKTIKYGKPNRDIVDWKAFSPAKVPDSTWMCTVVFDYGEHNVKSATPTDAGDGICRLDPHSSYHAVFEIRTYRCQRILMFHYFPNHPGGRGARCFGKVDV